MAALPRASLLVGAIAALGALLLHTHAPDDSRPRDDVATSEPEDAVSYIQRFSSTAHLNEQQLQQQQQQHNASAEVLGVKFYKKGDERNEQVIPRPGADYPEQLRGVFWLDEVGLYGRSDPNVWGVPLLVSFANSLDFGKRFSSIKGYGPTFTWSNNPSSYNVWWQLKVLDFRYEFYWNEDYTSARIYPTIVMLGIKQNLWSIVADFRMVLQTPATEGCPPKPGASKEEVKKCANWIRRSKFGWKPWEWTEYPVFRVLDDEGAPIAGNYDAYAGFAAAPQQLEPNVSKAKSYLGSIVGDPVGSLWFAGRENGPRSKFGSATAALGGVNKLRNILLEKLAKVF